MLIICKNSQTRQTRCYIYYKTPNYLCYRNFIPPVTGDVVIPETFASQKPEGITKLQNYKGNKVTAFFSAKFNT